MRHIREKPVLADLFYDLLSDCGRGLEFRSEFLHEKHDFKSDRECFLTAGREYEVHLQEEDQCRFMSVRIAIIKPNGMNRSAANAERRWLPS